MLKELAEWPKSNQDTQELHTIYKSLADAHAELVKNRAKILFDVELHGQLGSSLRLLSEVERAVEQLVTGDPSPGPDN